ncbi:DUF1186 domain-containing protein [Bradyrhizobium cytisi]|uniref:DUF1186 domain-containing protein n=1 Tax=Bradyrhizobium cytisi TaxID=515489 RepID=A0A5S4VZQ7_9BRAD|nr:DUF1186 domain-containing protein [Bradyrhizobium cytisi]
MASVFDGNPQPLCEIIHDENADEFVRSRMIEAIALLTLRGDVSRGICNTCSTIPMLRLSAPKMI